MPSLLSCSFNINDIFFEQWLISHFFPTISHLCARLAGRVFSDKFGGHLHLARLDLNLQSVFEIQISLLRYVCDINITQYGQEDEGTDFTKYRQDIRTFILTRQSILGSDFLTKLFS